MLSSMDHEVEFFENEKALTSQLRYGLYHVVIIDLSFSQSQNIERVHALKKANPHVPILGICHSESEAHLKLGIHLLEKRALVERLPLIWEMIAQRVEGNFLLDEHLKRLIGGSYLMTELKERIRQIAPLKTPVLIEGESGSGKELVARALSVYREPFIPVNCSAIPEHLFESELFGHQKGAFTGALANRKGLLQEANGGTLFLDEVAELPLGVQAKLLRALQESEIRPLGADRPLKVEVRVLCATHRNLKEEVEAGRFREDLYYRLSVVPLGVSPLRDRREDLPLLIQHFIKKYSPLRAAHFELDEESKNWIQSYDFPGNIRELENHIQRALSYHNGIDDKLKLFEGGQKIKPDWHHWDMQEFENRLKQMEKDFLIYQLSRFNYSVSKTAESLGMKRSALQNRFLRMGISSRELKAKRHS